MRVIHFFQPCENQAGERLTHIADLAKAQADAGIKVGIVRISTIASPGDTREIRKTANFCSAGFLPLHFDGSNAFSNLASMMQARQKAVRFIQALVATPTSGPLILHGHGPRGGELARQVQKKLARKYKAMICVYSPHGTLFKAGNSSRSLAPSQKALWQHTQGILFNSSGYERYYHEQFGQPPCPTTIIYDGVREDLFVARQIIDMAADFLFIGDLTQQAGIDTMVKALARMKKDFSTSALIVGSGSHEQELRAQVDRYAMSHNIFFNAPLDAHTAFLKGGCLVLPARLASIPYVALQAIAAGMPVILTNEGGLPELTGKIDLPLIKPDDVEALQQQLTAYLTSPQAYLARASALKQRVAKEFTMARMSEETSAFYLSLARNAR